MIRPQAAREQHGRHAASSTAAARRHCRTPPAHRYPQRQRHRQQQQQQQRQRQRVTEGTAIYGPIEWAQ